MSKAIVMSSTPYDYWALKTEIEVSIKSPEKISPSQMCEEVITSILSRQGGESNEEICMLYLLLWLCNKLPGAYQVVETSGVIGKVKRKRSFIFECPRLIFLKTLSFTLPELIISDKKLLAYTLKYDEVVMEISMGIKSFSTKRFKSSTVDNYLEENPHCLVAPVITQRNFKEVAKATLSDPAYQKVKDLMFKDEKQGLSIIRKLGF